MVNIAVINSTKAYLLGNDSLQLLQRPSSKKYPKTGILSFILIGSLQEKQCDPGLITLIFFGTLYMTTFKKLPNAAPSISRTGIMRVSGRTFMLLLSRSWLPLIL